MEAAQAFIYWLETIAFTSTYSVPNTNMMKICTK